jgi:parvulin-like peptidyl-prolyl isomerase
MSLDLYKRLSDTIVSIFYDKITKITLLERMIMKSLVVTLSVAILLTMTTVFVGQAYSQEKKADANTIAPDSNSVKVSDIVKVDEVLAIVNGTEIKDSQVMELITPNLDRQLASMPEDQRQQQKEMMIKNIKPRALDSLVLQTVVEQALAKADVNVPQKEIDDQIAEIAKSKNLEIADFRKLMEEQGMSWDDLNKRITMSMKFEKYLDKELKSQLKDANDEQVKEFYNQNISRFSKPEQVRASHVLYGIMQTPEGTDPNAYKKEQLEKAQKALAKIKGGADFNEIAKLESSCPSGKNGGDLNYFSKGQMVPEFENVAFALPVGQVSDVVETQFGYHIIKTTDHKAAEVQSLEQVSTQIKEELTNTQKRELGKKFIDDLKAKANIVYPGAEKEVKIEAAPVAAPKATPAPKAKAAEKAKK